MGYDLVTATNAADLVREVNKKRNEGYELVGGAATSFVVIATGPVFLYTQAIIKCDKATINPKTWRKSWINVKKN